MASFLGLSFRDKFWVYFKALLPCCPHSLPLIRAAPPILPQKEVIDKMEAEKEFIFSRLKSELVPGGAREGRLVLGGPVYQPGAARGHLRCSWLRLASGANPDACRCWQLSMRY